MWKAAQRATLLIPSGPAHDPDRMHLHIVVTDPGDNEDRVLVVSVTSIPSSHIYDSSCTLFPGEHPFVVKDSYVAYRFTRLVKAATLEALVSNGDFIAKPMLDAKIFEHVVVGLLESPQASPAMKKFLKQALGH